MPLVPDEFVKMFIYATLFQMYLQREHIPRSYRKIKGRQRGRVSVICRDKLETMIKSNFVVVLEIRVKIADFVRVLNCTSKSKRFKLLLPAKYLDA